MAVASIENVTLNELDPYSWSTSFDVEPPILTSSRCTEALASFFLDKRLLSVATEASSHPTGIESLLAQPWLYAGGGLGNMDECPLQVCLAGEGLQRDSITFGSVCVVPECSAQDMAAEDFVGTVMRVSTNASDPPLAQEYTTLLDRIAELNKFLGTGWICGDFVVPFTPFPLGLAFVGISLTFIVATVFATITARKKKGSGTKTNDEPSADDDRIRQGTSTLADTTRRYFDASNHAKRLTLRHSEDTAILDGMRVFSVGWIILGHTMAIMSSSGAGYKNPSNFLPPNGLTNTVLGQLLFSSRFAVDTFLCLSGYLVVKVLDRKFPRVEVETGGRWSVAKRYLRILPSAVLGRLARILPVYLMSLGFYTQVAPQLGDGPFWYQWLGLLKPCHDFGWTNLLFVNNFIPWDIPITETCFYHSWYLAVDMQLFVAGIFLVFLYQSKPGVGRRATLALSGVSVLLTIILSYTRNWSINTFDGAAVSRFEVEAYAKPHIRAQAYLSGMYVAMILPRSVLERRTRWSLVHHVAMTVSVASLVFVSFVTVFGAYGRRACRYKEWPEFDDCGSLWSPTTTFLYTALSRTIWSSAVSTIMYLSLGRESEGSLVSWFLSWKCWVPLSHLSFSVFLVHPIVIFVWQLGDREKDVFRLLTFFMNYISVSVVSYVAALCLALTVEFPCAEIWKSLTSRHQRSPQRISDFPELVPLDRPNGHYGSC